MDQIQIYLDAVFANFPHSRTVEEAKNEMRTKMEASYSRSIAAGKSPNEALGRAIAEYGDIGELQALVAQEAAANYYAPGGSPSSADSPGFHPPDATAGWDTHQASDPYQGPDAHGDQFRYWDPKRSQNPIQVEEAQEFAKEYHRSSRALGGAVALFVISPVLLVGLSILSSDGEIGISSPIASLIGFAFLLPIVAVGVVLLMLRSQKLSRFSNILEGNFIPTAEVDAWAQELKDHHSAERTTGWAVGTTLWILAALPLIAGGVLSESFDGQQVWIAAGLAATLLLVAAGLWFALPRNWTASVFSYLTDPDDARRTSEQWTQDSPPIVRGIYAAYWPIIVAAYLLWSFTTGAWHISWIIWPIAGLVFAAFSGFAVAWQASRK